MDAGKQVHLVNQMRERQSIGHWTVHSARPRPRANVGSRLAACAEVCRLAGTATLGRGWRAVGPNGRRCSLGTSLGHSRWIPRGGPQQPSSTRGFAMKPHRVVEGDQVVSPGSGKGKESAVDVRQVSHRQAGMHPSSGICSASLVPHPSRPWRFGERSRKFDPDASADERPVQHLLRRWRIRPVICLHVRALFAGVE